MYESCTSILVISKNLSSISRVCSVYHTKQKDVAHVVFNKLLLYN